MIGKNTKGWIAKNIVLRVNDKIRKQMVLKYYSEFEKSLKYSPDKLSEIRNQKLVELIKHAYDNVLYYKELFDANGLTPNDIKTLDDLKLIPPLTRKLLQNNKEKLIDRNNKYRYVSRGSSSGSTGQAVTYYHDEFGSSAGVAAHYIGWNLGGYNFGDKVLHIWGNPSISKHWMTKSSKIKSKLLNVDKFPAYTLSNKDSFQNLVNIINKNRYDVIDGYTNAIYLLAKFIEDQGVEIYRPKTVFTTAENLQEYQKVVIERNIGKVFDEYGCGEINGIAYQSVQTQDYLIIDSHVVVEFDKLNFDNKNPLIITDLDNRIMPLIRYQNGDLAMKGDMNKDVPYFNKLKEISGRMSDIIELPGGGNLVVPSFFGSFLLKDISSIVQYQVHKVAKDKLEIYFVAKNSFDENEHFKILSSLKEYLNEKIDYEVFFVDELNVEKNGKFKLVIDKTKV